MNLVDRYSSLIINLIDYINVLIYESYICFFGEVPNVLKINMNFEKIETVDIRSSMILVVVYSNVSG